MAGKHGPNRWASFYSTHEAVMEGYRRDGFVVSDDLQLTPLKGAFVIAGRIWCLPPIFIDARKIVLILEEGGNPLVQTIAYNYNVVFENKGNIFRYDSPHHGKQHHVHRYDVLSGDDNGRVTDNLSEDERPTLGEVIKETRDWYYDHYDYCEQAEA